MKKAPDAFRTISEVAQILETPAHVLRFWESKFYQIRPVKRAGGRRYYRPDDVALINGIRHLLQVQGMAIRGVQRILQEQGVKVVASMGGPLPQLSEAVSDIGPEAIGGIDLDAEVVDGVVEDAELVSDESTAERAPGAATPAVPEAAAPAFAMPAEPDVALANAESPDAAAPVPEPVAQQAFAVPEPTADLPLTGGATRADTQVVPAPATGKAATAAMPVAARGASPAAAPDLALSADAPDRVRIAHLLRGLPRGGPGPQRDRMNLLARRIDTLLERMSEASGAGRW